MIILFVQKENLFIFHITRARQIKLSKIASILDIETVQINTINQQKILTATTYNPYQIGKDFILTIVRKCPAK